MSEGETGPVATELTETDQTFLRQAIEISRRALIDEGKTPFGALIVIDGQIAGEGTSSVIELCDPTAHAEVMALRNAAKAQGRHLLEDAVMYSSSEPCPLCLAACYWARVPRLIFGATSLDVARWGFEDLQYYREFTYPLEGRSLREDSAGGPLQEEAVSVLQMWAENLPEPVVPKL